MRRVDGLDGYVVDEFVTEGGMGLIYDVDSDYGSAGDRKIVKFVRDDFWAKVEFTVGISLHSRFPDSFPEVMAFREGLNVRIGRVMDKFHGYKCAAIVMEYLRGASLSQYLDRCSPTLNDLVDVGMKILRALHRMHELGIVYRDLKAENVMIGADLSVKLIDFGLVHYNSATVVEDPCCTPESNSPEMWTRPESVDKRHDLYSFGVLLYEMVNKRQLPFRLAYSESRCDYRRKHLHETPEPCSPEVPERLAEIIKKLLEKDRNRRYQSAFDVAVDIAQYMIGQDPSLRIKDPYYGLLGTMNGGKSF